MKRLFLLFATLIPIGLMASEVSPEKAAAVARQILTNGGSRSSSVRLLAEDPARTKASGLPAYYVFEGDRGGFAIVPSDDGLSPVIGWSPDGTFCTEGMPPHVRAWMEMWERIVGAVRSGRLGPAPGAVKEWAALASGEPSPSAFGSRQLETAQWDQLPPYNAFCPVFEGKTCVTGCVATATAIVMRYHEWPVSGTGVLPSYTFTDDEGKQRMVGQITLGYEYQWGKMPLELGNSSSAEEQNAVARLIYDVGVMVRSNYNPGGTGAYTSDVYPGLAEHFGYDASAFEYHREYYSDARWREMLMDNIDKVGPVLYSGYSEEGGHAFVLDGYNTQGLFHINWGWGGRNNAFYAVPAFDEYVEGHSATLGLRKDFGGHEVDGLFIDGGSKGEKGLSSETEIFRRGEPFNIECKYIFNLSSHPFKGDIAVAILHSDGTMGEILDSLSVTIQTMMGISLSLENAVITGNILIGDKICLWYRSSNTPEWTVITGNVQDGAASEIPIADALSIEDITSFRYTSATGVLLVSTKEDVLWRLTDASGKEWTEGISFEGGALSIDTNLFPKASYFLTLSKADDIKTVEFVFGKK